MIRGGTFYDGIFRGGIFLDGIFHYGTFKGGDFYGGSFLGGSFLGGTFKSGYFHAGVFHAGDFCGGTFKGGEWRKSPLSIKGTKHLVVKVEDDFLCIGCEKRPISEWLENYEKIGRENEYSNEEILEYKEYIDIMKERYK